MLTETLPQLAAYLGPAVVADVRPGEVILQLTDGRDARARLALAYPYAPAKGDIVLVIGNDDFYVIGVLQGRGQTRLDVAGDLELRASGSVRISGGKEIDLQASGITLRADRVETLARRIIERAQDVWRWVKGTARLFSKRRREVVDEDAVLRAKRIAAHAEDDVAIDGKMIKLG